MGDVNFTMYSNDTIHPGFSIDCVVLSFYKGKLRILLNKPGYLRQCWALPGGFMYNTENSDEAAMRILKFRTGLSDIFLKQFYLFTDVSRTDIENNREIARNNNMDENEVQWYIRRFISLGYYALVRYEDIIISKSSGEEVVKWYDVQNLPPLYSDHENIIKTALETIRLSLPIVPIGYKLLPEKFTISELRKIYEFILGKKLDRRNFQRKMLSEDLIIQLDEKKGNQTYNSPILYTYNKKKLTADNF